MKQVFDDCQRNQNRLLSARGEPERWSGAVRRLVWVVPAAAHGPVAAGEVGREPAAERAPAAAAPRRSVRRRQARLVCALRHHL